MLRSLKCFWFVLLAAVGIQSASAFSFWGPPESWQLEIIGYARLHETDYPGNSGFFNYATEFSFFPHNLAEEYRWNVPVLYYTYDPTFVDYFGSNGVRAVDAAFQILNAVPKASEIDPNDFPLDEARFNFTARTLHLLDLKSAALEMITTRLGLADPERWTWGIHDRGGPFPPGCPLFDYTIVQRNFDPLTWMPSRYVNGNLFTYFVDQPCPPDFRGDHADAVELKVNPVLDTVLTAVASPKITYPNISYYGMFHVGLTLDDAAGLRYLYHTNNVNFEQSAPGVQLFQTNDFSIPLFSSNLTLLAAQALTNNAISLAALYPGLTITSTTNFFTNLFVTNITATIVPGPPWAPAGSFTLAFATNVTFAGIQTNFIHTFGNVFTFQFIGGKWVAVPLTSLSQANGNQIVNFQTTTTTISQAPFGPAGEFTIATHSSNRLRIQPGPVGEFFIFPTNFCDLSIVAVQFTNIVPFTNFIAGATNTTVSATNVNGGSNVFNGQVLSNSLVSITWFTNHIFIVHPVICTNDTVAFRPGVDKVTFVRHDYDPLFSRFFTPVTNDFQDLASTTNHVTYTERFRRVVTRPDIIVAAADLVGIIVEPVAHDTGPGTLTQSNSAPPIAVAGPGALVGQMVLTFNKAGPVLLNSNPTRGDEVGSFFFFQWASFDGSANDPILYPDTASLANLEAAFAMTIQPDVLPTATVGQAYSGSITISGGQPPYAWSIAPLSLPVPPGLGLVTSGPPNSATATFSGTPTTAGTYPFRIQITDNTGLTVTVSEAIGVNPP